MTRSLGGIGTRVLLMALGDVSGLPMRVAGVVLGVVSLALLLMARRQLGKSFAVQPQAKELVTSGIYSRIRNPMYLFVDGVVLSAALFFASWWPVLIAAVLGVFQIRQARREVKVLEAAFGETYREYRRRTWF